MSVYEQLSRLLAGDLDEAEAAALRARIEAEPEVAAAWARMQALARGLVSLPDPELPPHLLEAVAAAPARPERFKAPWWGLPAAAAGVLALLAWPAALPVPGTRLALGPGEHVVEGEALVAAGETTAHIDGRARVVLAEEDEMKTAAAAGAAAGALLTVAVYEGTALLSGPEGETELAAGQTWTAPAPAARPPSTAPGEAGVPRAPMVSVATLDECKDSVDELSQSLEQAQMEAAFLRGQLATHEGDPVPWPEDVPAALLPDNLEAAFAEAFAGVGVVVGLHCEEYPCIVVVDEGAEADPEAWRGALQSIEDQLGDVNAMVGRSQVEDDAGSHTLGAYAISAPAEGEGASPRTKFRMDQAMESFGQE